MWNFRKFFLKNFRKFENSTQLLRNSLKFLENNYKQLVFSLTLAKMVKNPFSTQIAHRIPQQPVGFSLLQSGVEIKDEDLKADNVIVPHWNFIPTAAQRKR